MDKKTILTATLVFFSLCLSSQGRTPSEISVHVAISNISNPINKTITLHPGSNAYDAFTINANISFSRGMNGFTVTKVNGVDQNPRENILWVFYLNGKPCEEKIDTYILQDGDNIWLSLVKTVKK